MSIAPTQPSTTLRISPPISEKVTTQGPLPWLNDAKSTAYASSAKEADTSWGGDGFGFDDFLDVINPLQHLPVISHFYREYTGDAIAQEARIMGGGLIGGVVGLVASGINVVAEELTGDDVMGHVMALFEEDAPTAPAAQTAMAAPLNLMASSLPPAPNWAKREVANNENLQPLDFGPIDGKAAPEPYLPSALPEDRAVLSLFGPQLTDARAEYNAAQGVLMAQEIASDLDS